MRIAQRPSSYVVSPFRRARLRSALFGLVVAAGCLHVPDGVNGTDFSAIEVTVVDQDNAPVPLPQVVVEQKSGSQIIQKQGQQANAQGQVRFELLRPATFKVWAIPPAGYTGGGEANPVTVVVPGDEVVNVTVTLTKTAAAAGSTR